jgi:hypothetical protein
MLRRFYAALSTGGSRHVPLTITARRCTGDATKNGGQAGSSGRDGEATGSQPQRPASSRMVLRSNAPAVASKDTKESSAATTATSKQHDAVQAAALHTSGEIDYAARFSTPDYGPIRPTGLWKVDELHNQSTNTVEFRRIDDIESDIVEDLAGRGDAVIPYADEETWKHKLMFQYKFSKTPKHLSWKELGQEVECMDCTIEPDPHRPEELFTISFFFVDRQRGTRDAVWSARNDVATSEGLTDLMAAIGSCLGRSDVFRTIRFDDAQGTTRDVCFRKKSRYTSDIQLSFRPAVKYNLYERKEQNDAWETQMTNEGMSTWGFHPTLMDPEFVADEGKDPEGTYTVSLSTHAFAFVLLRSMERLLARPMKDFYRSSQLQRTVKVAKEDDIGLSHALKGWMGIDERVYPHFTPIDAIQEHWLGKDAPFTMVSMVNKLREMAYLKRRNPEFQSWLSVRKRDTSLAIRNTTLKLMGTGASTLFVPVGHSATVNRLLPKHQQRRIESKVSINAVLGMPDETRRLGEFKKITGQDRVSLGTGTVQEGGTAAPPVKEGDDTPSATKSSEPAR